MKIGFVTCTPEKLSTYFPTLAEPNFIPVEPHFTPDDQLAVDALRKKGHEVLPIVWGCPTDDLHHFDLVVVRSPWDYMESDDSKNRFINWVAELEQSGVNVSNPSAFMQWMLDKHYLQHLHTQGVAVIPTQYYEREDSLDLAKLFQEKGPFVIKPCISAAGIGLFHIKTAADASHHQDEVNQRLKQGGYMAQDFIPEITTQGEWSLIFIGGQYSHSVHKKPGADSILVHAERGGSLSFASKPPPSVIQFANAAYQRIFPAFKRATRLTCDPSLILYLRLDIIETSAGPVLIECEGVEPELFFRAERESQAKFCHAISQLL